MNKLGMVFGLAAVATLAGCKDPDFKRSSCESQNDVTVVSDRFETMPAEPKVVETKVPVATGDLSKQPTDTVAAEPEYTVYIVQSGDYLAKISKKYNVTINSIKRLNPSIKKDVIWVGQKLKLPGKIDVGVQTEPAKAAPAKASKKTYTPYTGVTKEYVVKNGDTLGGIAYGNGINIRQLKELNGLSGDALKVGQRLKIPAGSAAAPAATFTATVDQSSEKKVEVKTVEVKPVEKTVDAPAPVEAAPAEVAPAEAAAPADAAPAKVEGATMTYVVQEGDDMTGVSIRWGVSAADIRELNNMGESDTLRPGQVIKLPADAQQ